MSKLSLINVELQQIIESISPIVGVEVAIYDSNYTVIASTIANSHVAPGMKVKGGHIMRHVIRSGKLVVIEQPGQNNICYDCSIKRQCPEYADVTCPITLNNITIGVVSFTAFDEKQKVRLLNGQKQLSGFVTKLSTLIRSLVAEKELLYEKDLYMKKLETILSSINDGIIAIDEQGQIINSNELAIEILGLKVEVNQKSNINLIDILKLDIVLRTGNPILNKELRYTLGKYKVNVMISAWPIFHLEKIVGAVAVVRNMEDVNRLVNQLTNETINYTMDDIITCNPEMIDLKERAVRFAKSNSTILITGESGTGKEVLSRFIHSYSLRNNKPFVSVNCAAIPDTLLESELFGYEEGAFTGARKNGKPGKFELAHGGTLFLDEIGDMPLSLQAKLLRVLEDQRIERIGSIGQIQVNVRIIAATNKNIERLVKEREFREDLYFRLNVIPLRLPPLRDRREDITLLFEYFLKQYTSSNLTSKSLTDEALIILNNYSWPGNVRELRNCVEYALNTHNDNVITDKDLPLRITEDLKMPTEEIKYKIVTSDIIPNEIMTLEEVEKSLINLALNKFGENYEGKIIAANALGINLSTLYRKIKRHNL